MVARVWLACALWAVRAAAHAADVQVSPVSLHFGAGEQAQALWITNTGQEEVQLQVRVQRWTQPDGADILEPTRELVASPPLASVGPGQRQLVRIVKPAPLPADAERAYRVIVDELPVAAREPDSAGSRVRGQGLKLVLRYSLPVFVAPHGAPTSLASPTDLRPLSFRWEPGPTPRLHAANQGPRRVRIGALVHEDASGRRTVLVAGLLGYVLDGRAMLWEIPAARLLGPGTLKARFNDDPLEQALPMATPGP